MPFETPVHLIQSVFARGEVSPFLFGRVDLIGWAQGLRTLRNGFVRPEGSVSNRPGYGYVANSLTAQAKGSILVPFIFSATQSYVLEIGNLTAQVLSQGALVVNGSPVNITGVLDGFVGLNPRRTITTSTPHGLSAGQNVVITGVVATGSYQINGTWNVVATGGATTFYLQGSGDPQGAYTSGGTVQAVASFSTPWATADLPLLRWSQSSDTLTVVHPNYPPYEIKRTSATTFTCLAAVYVNGPFLNQNSDGVTFVYANKNTGTVTLTANSPIFNANHVGALFQLTQQDLSTITPWEPLKLVDGLLGTYRRSNL